MENVTVKESVIVLSGKDTLLVFLPSCISGVRHFPSPILSVLDPYFVEPEFSHEYCSLEITGRVPGSTFTVCNGIEDPL
jgi:hypothetical protein